VCPRGVGDLVKSCFQKPCNYWKNCSLSKSISVRSFFVTEWLESLLAFTVLSWKNLYPLTGT
jgi:hypothetical protein